MDVGLSSFAPRSSRDKFEIRISKIRNNDQGEILKNGFCVFLQSGCKLVSNFGFRISGFLFVKIIAIANQKGGVGKTTTAVNLGCALAEEGLRVLLIDLDPQGNATSSFGLQELEGESLYEPLLGHAAIVDKILPTRVERVFIVPADLDLAGAEVEIARLDNHLTRLAETLAPLRSDNTFD